MGTSIGHALSLTVIPACAGMPVKGSCQLVLAWKCDFWVIFLFVNDYLVGDPQKFPGDNTEGLYVFATLCL